MGWLAVTFYTEGTGYQVEVQKLAASARAQDVPLVAYPVKPRGSWRANLNAKSETVLEAMADYPKLDVVFIDADAVIRHRPAIFDFLSTAQEWDLGAHFYVNSRLDPGGELLSGTLWFANTAAGRAIVEAWDREGKAHPEIRHQKCLHRVLARDPAIRIYRLPASYTRIFDAPGMKGVEPVIEHFQASRRLRNRVRGAQPVSIDPFGLAKGKP